MRTFKSLQAQDLPVGYESDLPVVQVEETRNQIVITCAIPGFFLSDDEREMKGKKHAFHQLNVTGMGFITASGKPLLPSFGRYVQIPSNHKYSWTVKKGKPVEFDDITVLPAQQKLVDSINQKHEFEYDEETYKRDQLYPAELLEVTGPFEIDDYNALLVHIHPFQYNPAKKKLMAFANLTLTIKIEEAVKEDHETPIPDVRSQRDAFGNLFLNPRRGVEDRVEVLRGKVVPPPFHLIGPELLIIYEDALRTAADTLATWKIAKGIATDCVPISRIGNDVGKIKGYIRHLRSGFSRLRYVLLMGDSDQIASEIVTQTNGENNLTDYYYSTRTDPATPASLVFPWLSVGRLPVRNLTQATNQVNEIIKYEKNPPLDQNYFKTIALAAYFQDNDNNGIEDRAYVRTMETIRSYMIGLGFNVIRVYVTNSTKALKTYLDGTPVPEEVNAAFVTTQAANKMLVDLANQGSLIIAHRDHGSEAGWEMPPFKTADITKLIGHGQSLFYSVNCLTGSFGLNPATMCFTEALLNSTEVVPSLVAATRLSGTWLNDNLLKGLFDGMWGGLIPTFPTATASYPIRHNRLGDLLNYAKFFLTVSNTGNTAGIKDHWEIYHTLGDPTMEVWQSIPRALRMLCYIKEGELNIRLSECLRDSVVTIWWNNRILKQIEPASTQMHISLRELVPQPLTPIPRGQLKVTCFAPGHRFVEAVPLVVPVPAIPLAEIEMPI